MTAGTFQKPKSPASAGTLAGPLSTRKAIEMNVNIDTTTTGHNPSPALYKALAITLADESQVYICESHVDERHILSGDEAGIVCHMVDPTKADLLVEFLNRRGAQ